MTARRTLSPVPDAVAPTATPLKTTARKRATARKPAPTYGPIETGARSDVADLRLRDDSATAALSSLAFHLAHVLDAGDTGSQTASLARQLQAALTELRAIAERMSEGPDDFTAELSRAGVDAAAALGHAAQS